QVLTGQGLLPETRNYLGCLLYDLIHYFSDEITAPRWQTRLPAAGPKVKG
ncbi:hypothetical protein OM373_004546, partial [Salmonella enterica subsp. arizonae serovar 35:z4,z32:-]|nr:hypothetical protein [Salmonella enterica subsp. arizonae serovar 35:z4,z32:-]